MKEKLINEIFERFWNVKVIKTLERKTFGFHGFSDEIKNDEIMFFGKETVEELFVEALTRLNKKVNKSNDYLKEHTADEIEKKFPIGKKFIYRNDFADKEYDRFIKLNNGKICTVVDYAYPKGHICRNSDSNAIEVDFEKDKGVMVEQYELNEIKVNK